MNSNKSDRLDRTERFVEANARAIDGNASAIDALVRVVAIHQTDIQEGIAEIRGIRTEIRRISDYLFGQHSLAED